MKKAFSLDDVRPHLGPDAEVRGRLDARFANVRPIDQADDASLTWLSPKRAPTPDDGARALRATAASMVVAPAGIAVPDDVAARACVVLVANPKLAFARVAGALFAPTSARRAGVHPSATVHPEAQIAPDAYVGPHCHVGRARIGAGAVLDGHVHVYDGVVLGARAWVAANAVVGVDGFGFTRDEGGEWLHVPHLGGVRIGDDVRIGAHACVVRGTLGDTVIGAGTKLDNFVTVGHNARVGDRVLAASHAVIGGSSDVGDDVWISPHVTLLNGIKVGRGAVLGAGAVVAADVPEGAKLVARPGRVLPRALWRMRTPLA